MYAANGGARATASSRRQYDVPRHRDRPFIAAQAARQLWNTQPTRATAAADQQVS